MTRHVLVAVWLGHAAIVLAAQAPQKAPSGPIVDDKRLVMQVDQVAHGNTTQVFGDPAKQGTYVVRVKLAPNLKTRPRYYDHDRWVTVLKGTWWVGQGDVFNTGKLIPIREGGFMYQPAGLRTFDVAGDGEVVLQIAGNGPVKSTHAEVDAKGVAVPEGGPYPEEAAGENTGRRGRGGRRGQPPPM